MTVSDGENEKEPIEPPAEPGVEPPAEPPLQGPREPLATPPGEPMPAPAPRREPIAPPPPATRSEAASPAGRRPPRPNLAVERTPVSRDHGGYAFRLEPSDLALLRELPGSRGKTDEELGTEFLESHGERLAAALAGEPPAPASVRVLVDPYSRQIFLAVEDRIRGIVSF